MNGSFVVGEKFPRRIVTQDARYPPVRDAFLAFFVTATKPVAIPFDGEVAEWSREVITQPARGSVSLVLQKSLHRSDNLVKRGRSARDKIVFQRLCPPSSVVLALHRFSEKCLDNLHLCRVLFPYKFRNGMMKLAVEDRPSR